MFHGAVVLEQLATILFCLMTINLVTGSPSGNIFQVIVKFKENMVLIMVELPSVNVIGTRSLRQVPLKDNV